MIVEIGHYALVLALALSLVTGVAPLIGALRRDAALMDVARPAAFAQFLLVAGSFAALTWAHVVSDFSVINVIENPHSMKPMIYKVSGVWGNHEGSMLLWVLILAVFGGAVALWPRFMPRDLRALVIAVQSWIAVAFLSFILLTSNPFARAAMPPIEGNDLNPILQDPGLAIHPPLLYIGYVGFSIAFSFAAAALISGRIDAAWARFVRPWILIAWIFLTLGIAMGSYWAYYTLGWGGFWFWDPVENASLMPWLAGTALLHSAAVMEKREALKVWTIFLAILAFSLSLLGTFLVRSGVLTSVHAFATDPARGVYILLILVVFIGGSLALFAWRANELKRGGIFAPISREGALVFNNLLLTTSTATVFVGTLYPLALEALDGSKITVGAPFYNYTFVPLFVPIFIAMPIAQMLAWKRGDLAGATQRLVFAFGCSLGALAIFAWWHGAPILSIFMAGLSVFVMIGSFADIVGRIFGRGVSGGTALRRAFGLPLSAWGTAIAHAGMGVTLLGVAATGWGVERIVTMHAGDSYQVGPYALSVQSVEPRKGPNYSEVVAVINVKQGDRLVAHIEPSKRFFQTRRMNTTEAGIVTLGFGQVYVNLAEEMKDGAVDARLYWKPLVSLIWLGALVMALGGALSVLDRRLRVGVAARARKALPPGVQPAE